MDKQFLYHWGIKGMHWGVRRTPAELGRATEKKSKRQMSEDALFAKQLKKKKPGEMSNTELRKFNDRRQLETQYKSLNKGNIAKGAAYVASAAAIMGTALKFYNSSNAVIKVGKAVTNKVLDASGNLVLKSLSKGFSGG